MECRLTGYCVQVPFEKRHLHQVHLITWVHIRSRKYTSIWKRSKMGICTKKWLSRLWRCHWSLQHSHKFIMMILKDTPYDVIMGKRPKWPAIQHGVPLFEAIYRSHCRKTRLTIRKYYAGHHIIPVEGCSRNGFTVYPNMGRVTHKNASQNDITKIEKKNEIFRRCLHAQEWAI